MNDNRALAVQIVKELGQNLLPNGKSLREHLTVDEISLWDIMAPTIALYYVPVSLNMKRTNGSILRRLRPYITYTKHTFINFITRIKFQVFKKILQL